MSLGFLTDDVFRTVIDSTPLISIDLIVRGPLNGKILLGRRLNRPAINNWFVPGGRIRKNETMSVAFERLTREELGFICAIDSARLIGVYEHFYTDSVFGENESTHYVVIGHEISVDASSLALPQEQHSSYRWFDVEELLRHSDVHQHTKDYFIG